MILLKTNIGEKWTGSKNEVACCMLQVGRRGVALLLSQSTVKAYRCVRYPPTPLAGGQKSIAGTLFLNQDFLALALILTLYQTHPLPLPGGEPYEYDFFLASCVLCLAPCSRRGKPLQPLQLLQPPQPFLFFCPSVPLPLLPMINNSESPPDTSPPHGRPTIQA